MFRVGSADEQLAHRGLTHLTEHLAMPPHRRHHFECNATVEEARTVFWAHGSEDEVSTFLAATCAQLSSPPLDRLEAERGILRTEPRSNGARAED
jgi:zinc protease